jgi:hypothetical protein
MTHHHINRVWKRPQQEQGFDVKKLVQYLSKESIGHLLSDPLKEHAHSGGVSGWCATFTKNGCGPEKHD